MNNKIKMNLFWGGGLYFYPKRWIVLIKMFISFLYIVISFCFCLFFFVIKRRPSSGPFGFSHVCCRRLCAAHINGRGDSSGCFSRTDFYRTLFWTKAKHLENAAINLSAGWTLQITALNLCLQPSVSVDSLAFLSSRWSV